MSLHYISHVKEKNASSLNHLIPRPGCWFSSQVEFEFRYSSYYGTQEYW